MDWTIHYNTILQSAMHIFKIVIPKYSRNYYMYMYNCSYKVHISTILSGYSQMGKLTTS